MNSPKNNRLPIWFKKKIYSGKNLQKVKELLKKTKLNTICYEGKCPNKGECFSRGEVTFIIGGKYCTRNCKYCNVEIVQKKNEPIDDKECEKISKVIEELNLKYVVITAVTRDDLEDGGALHFKNTVSAIKKINKNTKVELLIPDFKCNLEALDVAISSEADVIGHNIEVAGKALFRELRPQGDYDLSLKVLNELSEKIEYVKSGFMVGFGETFNDIETTMIDLYNSGVRYLTAGQYLRPSSKHYPVKKYYTPDEFKKIEQMASKIGFNNCKAGPFVRSSYMAGDIFEK